MSAAPLGNTSPTLGGHETLDAISEVQLYQHRDGYRFSMDAMLLADFAGRPRGRVVDLGTGCGVIPLVMAMRGPGATFVGLELQAPLAGLAVRNVALNRCEDRVEILQGDLRQIRGVLPAEAFDLALSNPPYFSVREGRVSPTREKAVARHELTCSLPELAEAARYLLREGGSFKIIFPSPRMVELLDALRSAKLEPRRMRLVHPVTFRPAKLVMVEATKGAKVDLEVLPPLYLQDQGGGDTLEAQEILRGSDALLE